MFAALMMRHNYAFRRQCYVGGIVASNYINSVIAKDTKPYSPLDFVLGVDTSPREELKSNLISLFAMMDQPTEEQVKIFKARTIERLIKAGNEDAEEIWREVFPKGL